MLKHVRRKLGRTHGFTFSPIAIKVVVALVVVVASPPSHIFSSEVVDAAKATKKATKSGIALVFDYSENQYKCWLCPLHT